MDEAVAAAFLEQIHDRKPPDLTILSGDLTMRVTQREIDAASAFITHLPSPLIVLPGNHDVPGAKHLWERLTSPFERYQKHIRETLEPELMQDGIHTVCLNSSRAWGFYLDWSEGRLTPKQLAHAESRFLSETTADYRLLVLHHPLVELPLKGRAVVKPLIPLLECMKNSRVDLVLCGHFHRSIIIPVGRDDSWRSIVSQAPTVCSTRLQGEPQGYHEILLHSDHAEIIHWVYDGKTFSAGSVSLFARTATGWNPSHVPA